MANNVKLENGAEIYIDQAYALADQYIQEMQDQEGYTDEEMRALMRKPQSFKGMLKYIYNNLFKIRDIDIKYNNKNSRIDYGDINLLNNIWSIYTTLCYKYLQNPTLLNFSLFSGIDRDTFKSWMAGEYREGDGEARGKRSAIVKKWKSECESALVDSAMTGNPGPMFLLKADYGYTEAPQLVQVVGNAPDQTAADIAARHISGATMPPKLPDLGD